MAHAHLPAPRLVSASLLRVLAVATTARAPGFAIETCAGWAAADRPSIAKPRDSRKGSVLSATAATMPVAAIPGRGR